MICNNPFSIRAGGSLLVAFTLYAFKIVIEGRHVPSGKHMFQRTMILIRAILRLTPFGPREIQCGARTGIVRITKGLKLLCSQPAWEHTRASQKARLYELCSATIGSRCPPRFFSRRAADLRANQHRHPEGTARRLFPMRCQNDPGGTRTQTGWVDLYHAGAKKPAGGMGQS